MTLREYKRRAETTVVALRLDLDTAGFEYRKWGGTQHCKAGDWIVQNGDDTYTVDSDVFARTYRPVAKGEYEKFSTVWAERAEVDGVVPTKEGQTKYQAGDYLVYNDREGTDGWAITRETFEKTYEEA